VEIGTFDECFKLDSAMSCFREVEKIYTAAGVRERLELDLFEGGHQWGGNKSVAFFNKWLGGGAAAVKVQPTLKLDRTVWREVDPDEEEAPAQPDEHVPFAVTGGGSTDAAGETREDDRGPAKES
jgi:hypothetical protein